MGDIVKMFREQFAREDTGGTEILAFAEYPDLEKAADRTAAKIKEGFMEMGYILKVARDTDILAGSGYLSHEEFAEKRYGLDKGTVSRYIRIVERFSVGGNSHILQEGYKNIGFAKLSLMLHMPDAIAEEITETYSKQEVQAIKEEIDAERAVSDIEVAIENAGIPEAEKTGSLLDKAVRQLGREQPGLYRKMHDACRDTDGSLMAAVMEILAPQGDAIFMVRLPGTGRLMISISGDAANVTNVRSGEKEKYTAADVRNAVMDIIHGGGAEVSWQQEYGEPMEPAGTEEPVREEAGKSEVAPVQPKEKRKESKVIKAAPPKQPAKKTVAEAVPSEPETPLPGQMEVMDYPEAYPMGNAACMEAEKQILDVRYEEIPEEDSLETAGREAVSSKTAEPAAGKEKPLPAAEPDGAAVMQELLSPEESTAGQADLEEGAEFVRMEANGCLERLRKTFSIWNDEIPRDFLVKAHQDAVSLAAAIEKLMDTGRNGEERSRRC